MRRFAIILVFSSAVAVMTATGFAQGTAQPGSGEPTITFKSSVELVTVSASVRDARGRIVKNLKKSDFQVIDGGRPRPIRDFYAGESPVSLAILLDISGSMAVGGNMERARQAVETTLAQMQPSRDEAALYTFDVKLQEVVSFTTDLQRVGRVSLEGQPYGMTSLYDAVAATAKSVAARTNKHRALLVISDGVDTGSRLTARQVSGIASAIDVPVYLLTVVNPVDHPGGEFAVERAPDEAASTATLADLARWTGGDMRISSAQAQTLEAVKDLFSELRHQYLITFEPGTRPGWHPLEIRTQKKNQVVHARSGYMAGPARSGR